MRVRRTGQALTQDVCLVANHVSWMDILVLGGATGCAFVSKEEVGRWPLIGWLAAQNNTILIRRAQRGDVSAQVETLRAALGRHQPVALFPEGTTGDGITLQPFKPALFATFVPPPPGIRIQPVLIDYGAARAAMGWIGDEPALANARRILSRRCTIATLHFLDPLDPAEHPDRKALAAAAHGRIAAAMASFPGGAAPV
ncbi:MAG: lysophospholipid acyltransferase family protein [Sphingobium sp.]